MTSTLKVVIGVAGALVVGLVIGLVLGMSGKREMEADLVKARQQARETEETLKSSADQCAKQGAAARTSKRLLLAKEQLLRAMLELYANNYGLTSQHIGEARSKIRAAQKELGKGHASRANELFEKLADAQTLAGRLDPLTRDYLEKAFKELERLPGAR